MGMASTGDLGLEEIIRRAQILVVDDEDFPYATLFRREGYNVTKWRDVSKISEIEQGKFDVVLLDLQGIGRKLSADQGLGVLRHIKKARPSQVIVAYSNADWPVKYQPFFDKADRVLSKSADYVDFKREVDELLQEHFSVGFHRDRIRRVLAEAGLSGWRVNRLVDKSIRERDLAKLEKYLAARGLNTDDVQVVLGLVQVAIGVAQIWTS